jgi:type IV secretion system protein VirD4
MERYLTYNGSVVVIDPKGENYAVTARYRRSIGTEVIKFDPFGISPDKDTDTFNPFDVLNLSRAYQEDEVRSLTELLTGGTLSLQEPFWDTMSANLLNGLGIYLASDKAAYSRSYVGLQDILYSADAIYAIAKIADEKTSPLGTKQALSQFLSITDVTRSGILASAQQHLTLIGSPAVRRVIGSTSFDLKKIYVGEPTSIYIIIPPDKLNSHRGLLRLWIGALLMVIASRSVIPATRTLFLIDEAAQLGSLKLLETAMTLLRGYGLQTWSFWQDLSQLKYLYSDGWLTMINNCSVLQMFGANNLMVSHEFAEIMGFPVEEVRRIGRSEQVLVINGQEAIRAGRFDYLTDQRFSQTYDPNPFYAQLS